MESAKGGVGFGAETFIQDGNGDGQDVAGETEGPPMISPKSACHLKRLSVKGCMFVEGIAGGPESHSGLHGAGSPLARRDDFPDGLETRRSSLHFHHCSVVR